MKGVKLHPLPFLPSIFLLKLKTIAGEASPPSPICSRLHLLRSLLPCLVGNCVCGICDPLAFLRPFLRVPTIDRDHDQRIFTGAKSEWLRDSSRGR